MLCVNDAKKIAISRSLTKLQSYLENVRAEIFQLGREMTGEIEIALDNLAVHMLLVLGVKWNVAGRHLKDEHAHRPPVH